jgi:predicted RNase H-like HicB family nuclease
MKYTYFPSEGWYVGFFDDYPDWWTQGKTLEELKDMLRALLIDAEGLLNNEDEKRNFLPPNLFHGELQTYEHAEIELKSAYA